MLTIGAGPGGNWAPGDVRRVDDSEAAVLVSAGVAEEIHESGSTPLALQISTNEVAAIEAPEKAVRATPKRKAPARRARAKKKPAKGG